LREWQECAKLPSRQRLATLKNLKSQVDFDLFNTFGNTWFHMCYFIFVMSRCVQTFDWYSTCMQIFVIYLLKYLLCFGHAQMQQIFNLFSLKLPWGYTIGKICLISRLHCTVGLNSTSLSAKQESKRIESLPSQELSKERTWLSLRNISSFISKHLSPLVSSMLINWQTYYFSSTMVKLHSSCGKSLAHHSTRKAHDRKGYLICLPETSHKCITIHLDGNWGSLLCILNYLFN
jgi:hypothetical protein